MLPALHLGLDRRGELIAAALELAAGDLHLAQPHLALLVQPCYAAFVEVAAAMLPAETMAAIWRKVEAATPAAAEPSG